MDTSTVDSVLEEAVEVARRRAAKAKANHELMAMATADREHNNSSTNNNTNQKQRLEERHRQERQRRKKERKAILNQLESLSKKKADLLVHKKDDNDDDDEEEDDLAREAELAALDERIEEQREELQVLDYLLDLEEFEDDSEQEEVSEQEEEEEEEEAEEDSEQDEQQQQEEEEEEELEVEEDYDEKDDFEASEEEDEDYDEKDDSEDAPEEEEKRSIKTRSQSKRKNQGKGHANLSVTESSLAKKSSTFQTYLEQFQTWVQKHPDCGHGNVPISQLGHNLYRWTVRVRKEYANHKLSQSQIDALNQLGFSWVNQRQQRFPPPRPRNTTAWHDMFNQLKQYKQQHGNCHVPDKWPKDRILANWVARQRLKYKNNKLSQEHIQQLQQLGFAFQRQKSKPRNSNNFDDKVMFDRLLAFRQDHGHVNVPHPPRDSTNQEDNPPLSAWVQLQRTRYRRKIMSTEQIQRFEAVGFQWKLSKHEYSENSTHKSIMDDKIEQLKAFKEQHGHLRVPQRGEKATLAGWLKKQRSLYQQQKLSAECIQAMEAIGVEWYPKKGRPPGKQQQTQQQQQPQQPSPQSNTWDDMFLQLIVFKSVEGHCHVPRNADDASLYNWVQAQHRAFHQGTLSTEYIHKLESVGFVLWNQLQQQHWNQMFQQLQDYKTRFGHVQMPRTGRRRIEYKPLIEFVAEQRALYVSNRLPPALKSKLQDDLGLELDPSKDAVLKGWFQRYEQLKAYHATHGDCRVPDTKGGGGVHRTLSKWIQQQRVLYTKTQLPSDRVKLLEDLGFDWAPHDTLWNTMHQRLKEYALQHNGSTSVKPKHDKQLSSWVQQQRSKAKPGAKAPLNAERIAKLDELNFVWEPQPISEYVSWDDMLERLKKYKETVGKNNGSLHVPAGYDEDKRLANWANTQRTKKRTNKLSEERIVKLDALGFEWRPDRSSSRKKAKAECNPDRKRKSAGPSSSRKKAKTTKAPVEPPVEPTFATELEAALTYDYRHARVPWDDMLERLKKYKETDGDGSCNVPQTYLSDRRLAFWVNSQRLKKRKNKLPNHQIAKLDNLGFEWDRYSKTKKASAAKSGG